MLTKIALLFLVAISVLAIFGRARIGLSSKRGKDKAMLRPRKCGDCGSYVIGTGRCACGEPSRPD